MILIADSGSTKTDWRLIDSEGAVEQYKSAGINPYQQKEEDIRAEIMESLKPQINHEVHQVFFYGAGCSSKDNIASLERVFTEAFPNAIVRVNHDLMGAARALCGHEAGIACILGTGTNSCLYDGRDIISNVPSLGYALGDEGSGAWLGINLVSDFLRGDMDSDLADKLVKQYEITKDVVLENVYKRPMPNRYLAKFSRFLFHHVHHPYVSALVHRGFTLFMEKNVKKYENFDQLPVHFTGSIAFYYNNILRQVAAEQGIILKLVIESPIAGLTLFHQNSIIER
ncbi:N-acetylglucosamine kinase [Fulvivirga maritima]|uniref:N-acetylglucosamine kinase n=1 Tax=Fulvivirga maritima TaxID=2904247 RepID=UPI001F35EE4A|nr:N-acetylglucosamine kinase [Fulvivirga maritima]UII27818.1 N-acetylglucosamine kinase [Fulvivirga maritima]